MLTSKTIKGIIALLIALLILPNMLYIIAFFKNGISNDPEDWSQFANFFGGILNPIIAIFGTLILGYLSIQVGKQSSDENKRLFILEQRILAYQKLAQNLENIETQMFKTVDLLLINSALAKKLEPEELIRKYLNGLEETLLPLAQLQSTLNNFPKMYGHLFNYNFESDEYKELIKSCRGFVKQSKAPINKIINSDKVDTSKIENFQKRFVEDFKKLLNKLNEEIE